MTFSTKLLESAFRPGGVSCGPTHDGHDGLSHVDFKAIVITGASSGIGATLARRLSGPGRVLGLVGRNQERLDAVAAKCASARSLCRTDCLDIRDTGRLTGFLDAFDRDHATDLLIANAGILDGRHAEQVTESGDTARQVLEINLLATVATVHAVLPAMRQRRRGGIILVSSLAGFVPLADAPAYSASKAGLVSYGLELRDAVEDDAASGSWSPARDLSRPPWPASISGPVPARYRRKRR